MSQQLLKLSFSEEEFKTDDFDGATFVIEKKRHIPLDTLQRDLQTYFEHLQQEVVELINTDLYDNFLGVTNKLYGLDTELHKACDPLPEHLQRVDCTITKLNHQKLNVRNKLKELHTADDCCNFYVHLLKLHLMEKETSQWLHKYTESHGEGGYSMLYRISVQCNQLQADERLCIPAKGTDQEEEKVQIIEKTTRHCQTHKRNLEHAFVQLLEHQQELLEQHEEGGTHGQDLERCNADLKCLLECYVVLNLQQVVAKVFKKTVAQIVVDTVLTRGKTAELRHSEDTNLLSGLLSSLLQRIDRYCMPFVQMADEIDEKWCLISRSIWPSIVESIKNKMNFIFSHGIADSFHFHYSTVNNLLQNLQKRVKYKSELETWQHSKQMEDWTQCWRLSVYSTLRTKGLQANVTKALGTSEDTTTMYIHKLDTVTNNPLNFHYGELYDLYECFTWLWSDTVFIYAVTHSLLKQTIRVSTIVERFVKSFCSQETTKKMGQDGGITNKGMDMTHSIGLFYDVLQIQTQLKGPLYDRILSLLGCKEYETQPAKQLLGLVEDILCNKCSGIIGNSLPCISQVLCGLVGNECLQRISLRVRNYPSQYRMTKKVPERFDAYVTSILTPVHQLKTHTNPVFSSSGGGLVGGGGSMYIPKDIVEQWILEIVTSTTTKYERECVQIFEATHKAAEARRRLKKGKAGENNKNTVTDLDNIKIQVYLDLQEYGNQLKQFGFERDFEPYRKLLMLVEDVPELMVKAKQIQKQQQQQQEASSPPTLASLKTDRTGDTPSPTPSSPLDSPLEKPELSPPASPVVPSPTTTSPTTQPPQPESTTATVQEPQEPSSPAQVVPSIETTTEEEARPSSVPPTSPTTTSPTQPPPAMPPKRTDSQSEFSKSD